MTLLLASVNGRQMRPRGGDRPFSAPAECRGGRSPVCSGPQRACGRLGLVPPAGCCSTSRASHTSLRRAEPFAGASGDVARCAPADGSFWHGSTRGGARAGRCQDVPLCDTDGPRVRARARPTPWSARIRKLKLNKSLWQKPRSWSGLSATSSWLRRPVPWSVACYPKMPLLEPGQQVALCADANCVE